VGNRGEEDARYGVSKVEKKDPGGLHHRLRLLWAGRGFVHVQPFYMGEESEEERSAKKNVGGVYMLACLRSMARSGRPGVETNRTRGG